MFKDKLKLASKIFTFLGPALILLLRRRTAALLTRWSYKSTPDAKNVVVLGGSFGGLWLVERLAETLPTGYRIILIEKNSHLNYQFNFPRFSVISGYEHLAFIPYDGIAKAAPEGMFARIQDTVVDVNETHVILASGAPVPYEYLAIATGTSQAHPVQVNATEHDPACTELRSTQKTIKESRKIAVVGGGPVGVQLSTDIKTFYPEKDVTLVHSRDHLLNNFAPRLHDYALPIITDDCKVRVLLNERPAMPGQGLIKGHKLAFADGQTEHFDLVIGCLGQRPNTAFLQSYLADAVSKQNGRILVKSNLSVETSHRHENGDDKASSSKRIFAFGDVANTDGPKMARAAIHQADVVHDNILAMINGLTPAHTYKPRLDIEGALKLTLGKSHTVIYSMDDYPAEDGSCKDLLVPMNMGKDDLGIASAWRQWGADIKTAKPLDKIS